MHPLPQPADEPLCCDPRPAGPRIPPGRDDPITGRRVTGSSFGGVKGRTQVPQYVERWLAGEIDVESLISHRLTLDLVNHGFELMEAQDGIRSVISFA